MLIFEAQPPGASVYIDEVYLSTARHPVPVTCGIRRISVLGFGYFPHDFILKAAPGVTKIRIALRKIPSEP